MNIANMRIKEDFLSKTEDLVSGDLAKLTSGDAGKGLKLTGLEIVGFLAVKVLIPIVCAFVKDVLYQKYKDLNTKKAAAEAKEQLLLAAGPFSLHIDRYTLVREVSQSLTTEGVPAALAQQIVEQTLTRVEKELAPASVSER
jgi:hypothetical protein